MAPPTFPFPAFSARSWARPWRAPRPSGGRRSAARIAVIGNCQAEGVAESLRLLLPDAAVETLPVARLEARFGHLDRLARHLGEVDHVFAQFFPEGFLPGGNVHALAERVRLRLFPTILFAGFHPDLVHVGDEASLRLSRLVASPIGPYHSAIALCAYRSGLGVAATLRLYDGETFARLGYDRMWEAAADYLLRTARDVDFALERDFALWCRGGVFMHTINHPRLMVLGDIARRLAREAGLTPLDLSVEACLPDALAREAVWPVMPALAERLGVPGATLFKGDGRRGPARLLDLPEFVAESFALYARLPMAALTCARIDDWVADPGIRAVFDEAGRG